MNKKMKELKNVNESDLKNKLEDLSKELIKESAQIAIGTAVKNPAKIRNLKKNRARIMFLLHSKSIQNQSPNVAHQTIKQEVKPKA